MQKYVQVIQFGTDGTVQHTLKDSFFNPFPGKKRKIQRMTKVLPTEDGLQFYCEFTMGPHTGKPLTKIMFLFASLDVDSIGKFNINSTPDDDTAYFHTYEEAVEAEVLVINKMREFGVLIDDSQT